MIQASELRIGNWISVSRQTGGNTHYIQIENVFGNSANWDDGFAFSYDLEIADPIPLKPALLESLGFEYRTDTTPKRWNKKMFGSGSTMHLYEVGGEICFSPYESNYTLKITSLHQLQNLYFAISGKELEVVSLPNKIHWI